jgi:carbon-monoxide dehydrogenase small subunit
VARGEQLHPLQESFIECGGFQCGFCTPGMILLAKTLLDQNPNPNWEEVQEYMDANICRCTGYQMIIESILHAARKMRESS